MKKYLVLFCLLFNVLLAQAQRTISDPNVEKREVSGFHGIDVATGIRLVLTKGSTESVAVSAAKEEYRDKIVTKVEKGILKIQYETKKGSINKTRENKELRAYVSYTSLDELTVTTGAEVEIEGTLEADKLALSSNTGGEVDGKINVAKLDVKTDTGAKMTLTGKADELKIDADTGAKLMGEELTSSTADIVVSTGAKVWITTEKELKAKASTGAQVYYKGTVSSKVIKKDTGGVVTQIKK